MRPATKLTVALATTLALAGIATACGEMTTGLFAPGRTFASAATRPADYVGPLYRFANVSDAALVRRFVITVESDGILRLYRLLDGAEVVTTVAGDAARLSPDGRLALTNHEGHVKLWDLKLPQFAQAKVVCDHTALAMGFSPDASHLYIVTKENPTTAIILDPKTCERIATLEVPGEDISSVAIAPDGRHALTASRVQGEGDRAFRSPYATRTSSARLWDLTTGKEVAQHPCGPKDSISRLGFSLDGVYAAVNGRPIWTTPDAPGPTPVPGDGLLPAARRAQLRGPALSLEGDYLQVADAKVPIQAAAFTADDARVLLGTGPACYDIAGVPSVALFETTTGKLLAHFKDHKAAVTHVLLSQDGRHALARDASGAAVIYALPR
jgi:hypothetical protein